MNVRAQFTEPEKGTNAAARGRVEDILHRHPDLSGPELLRVCVLEEFYGKIALVSSFGAEAAVLLHMVSQIARGIPVIFLDTQKMFGETLRYRDELKERLNLKDLRSVQPDLDRVGALDPKGHLWRDDPDLCCYIRKVEPLDRAIAPFDAWVTGRKRFHGGNRDELPLLEAVGGKVKINPLAGWSKEKIDAYFEEHNLPRHPLEADGFLSIGCMPCTDRVEDGEDARAGRWRGQSKQECGIHMERRPTLTLTTD